MKKHTVKINILDRKGDKKRLMTGTSFNLPGLLFRRLFGGGYRILVLTPTDMISNVEICEVRTGGSTDGR